MTRGDNNVQYDDDERRYVDNSRADNVGPQGAALILELQRLRQAFEHENASDLAPPQAPPMTRETSGSKLRQRTARPAQRKSKMARAINACLEQFGFSAASPAAPGVKKMVRNAAAAVPARLRRRSIAPADPTPLAPEPEHTVPDNRSSSQLVPVDTLRSTLPSTERDAATRPTLGQLIDKCRVGVMAGTAFLVNRDRLAETADAGNSTLASRVGRAYENELRTGLRVLIAAGVLIGGWSVLMPLAGAVVVPGNLVVQSNVKTIQHPTGGIVSQIAVHNGMRVGADDLLLRLDATQAQASLQVVSKQLDEFRIRIARLIAERDGHPQIDVPPEMAARAAQPGVKALLASEESLFKARANGRQSQQELLQSRITQLGEEISGLDAQLQSKAGQLELIAGELAGIKELYEKKLVPLTRLTTLQREKARIEGERGQLIATIAETKAKIGEAQLQIVRVDKDFQTDVVKELGEAQGKEAELVERGVAARDVLERIDIRAPTSGVIHQLAVHTIGGVIRAGDTIMEIVPDSDDLQVEARLQPNDIDQVRKGQKAFIRFSAFNQRVTPQLTGEVSYVSADISRDQQTNAPFFTVRIALPNEERRRLAGLQLVSGMPAEVFMQTGSRTMMSYLLKPITDQLQRAFIER